MARFINNPELRLVDIPPALKSVSHPIQVETADLDDGVFIRWLAWFEESPERIMDFAILGAVAMSLCVGIVIGFTICLYLGRV